MNALKIFENAKKNNRLTHLYLLTGKVGVNKMDLVYDACHLILKDYDKRENLIDVIKNNSHTQIHYIQPDGNVIKKEQILNLQKSFSKTSLVDAPRIYIIEDVDVISTSAANSLLKFMEEPENSRVYGILTTSNQSGVLPTITSRAQIIRVLAKAENIVYNSLIEDEELDPYLVKSISLITNDLLEAKVLLNDENFKLVVEFISNYFSNYKKFSIVDLNIINNIIVDRKLYHILIELLLINYEQILKHSIKEVIFIDEIINEDTKKLELKYLLKNIDLLKAELIKQSSYININLSLDNLTLKLKKEM